jgi:uncharacterized protein
LIEIGNVCTVIRVQNAKDHSFTKRTDVADHFRSLNAFHTPEKQGGPGPRILVDGSDAVVLADIRHTVKATGAAYHARCALHLTVEGGVITRYHVYEDSLTVAQALTGNDVTN